MGSVAEKEKKKPHVVCIPFPAQAHINAMIKLAKLLHHRGFHISFINTEFNHKRLLKARGPDSLKGLPGFQFHTIPDGLPPSNMDATQDLRSLSHAIINNFSVPFRNLLHQLNADLNRPPVTGIISDGCMGFTLQVADELRVPQVFFWTHSACGFFAYMNTQILIDKGFIPLKEDSANEANLYLDTPIDFIPGLKNMRLRDLPSSIRTTDSHDLILGYLKEEIKRTKKAGTVILNTFDGLDQEILDALSTMVPHVNTIGPLQLLINQLQDNDELKSIGSNLWKEEPGCLEWLDSKEPGSVVYVNFGSVTVMTIQHLIEFAWGLVNSEQSFLWIIRPDQADLVVGNSAVFPPELMIQTKERGKLASWCPQEQVLRHPAIGGFLTHSGWNSTLDSICGGVPMICWPFFSEQPTNCRYCCVNWGIGDEINKDVKREEVEKLVRDLMVGDKGKEMKKKAMELKKKAEEAITPGGSSYVNFDNLVKMLTSTSNVK